MGLPPPRLPGSYLVVELTNRCSLSCVHCSVSEPDHAHHARTGYLDPAIFEALVDDLVHVGATFDSLILFWLGEPLLHPHFAHIWRHALRASARHGTFGKVEVHTNATHLTPRRVDAALNGGETPQVWHLTLDAATRQTYTQVKGRDRFDKVDGHVAHFLRTRAQRDARWPRPVLQFIVGPNNAHEITAFRARWEGLCRQIGTPARSAAGHVPPGDDPILFFRQLDCPTPALQQATNALFRDVMARQDLDLPAASARGQTIEAANPKPCSGFWKSPVVSWLGELTTCTRDSLLHNQVGDLRTHRFSDLWWGGEMRGRRARVARGDYTGMPICQTCFIPRSLNHAALGADDIARQAAHDDARAAGN